MKICHLISGDLWAGAEVVVCNLLRGIKFFGPDDEILAIVLNSGRLAEELEAAGIVVKLFDESEYSFLALAAKIRNEFLRFAPNVVHTHRYKENLLAFCASIGMRELRLIATQHGLPENPKHSLFGAGKAMLNHYVLAHHFSKVVAVSKNIENFFIQDHGFKPEKVALVNNGIEMFECSVPREPSAGFTVGSSGRLFPVKGYSLLVDIAALLAQCNDISVRLAGDGPQREDLEAAVQRNNLDGSFRFEGHVDDIYSFYECLDVYISTSYHEGIPMSVLEAMSHGLPVIAPRVGGFPEIIEDGVEGFLIDGREPSDFVDKCLLLYNDRNLYRRMSVAAREKVSRLFSMHHMVDRYRNCYQELLDQ